MRLFVNHPTDKSGGLQLGGSACRVRRVDSRPTGDVARSDGIGGASEPAADTRKMGWVGPVARIDQAALRTGPRRVGDAI